LVAKVKKWVATIRHYERKVSVGYFVDPEDAARLWDQAAYFLRGEFERLNFAYSDRPARDLALEERWSRSLHLNPVKDREQEWKRMNSGLSPVFPLTAGGYGMRTTGEPGYVIERYGGRGGVRTHDTREGMPVFKTGAINHSATLPY
jgi:hypothetical protein